MQQDLQSGYSTQVEETLKLSRKVDYVIVKKIRIKNGDTI